ncbi:MAG: tRNA (N(6)-L-threonylcarbamoyladenosine(37)-C(2))-methylthiotransferase MtaB [Acidobacteriota bacterium]
MTKPTFNVINFGCRATQADGAAVEQAFRDSGLKKSENWETSDLVVVNTCTVTHAADAEARQAIRRIHRENPRARIVVTGCYAQRAPEELANLEGVTCVVGNSHKEHLVPLVMQHHLPASEVSLSSGPLPSDSSGAAVYCSSIFESTRLRAISDFAGGGRTRPVLKVQDGCSYRCSYCVIPYVRGNSRSLPPTEVLRQVDRLLDQGFQEIVLTGIHLGGYGRDWGDGQNLASLIRLILSRERLQRLRLSSVEPLEMTEEIIDLIASSDRMARHFHVPLQSGSDRILRLMRRPYTAEEYLNLTRRIRKACPDAAIGADVMVGFPTESEEDHKFTQSLLAAAPLTYLHVFPYSSRPGTASLQLSPEVPPPTMQRRSRELRTIGTIKNHDFRATFLGRTLSAISLDSEKQPGTREALTSNYLKVELVESNILPNRLFEVMVTGLTDQGVKGSVERATSLAFQDNLSHGVFVGMAQTDPTVAGTQAVGKFKGFS